MEIKLITITNLLKLSFELTKIDQVVLKLHILKKIEAHKTFFHIQGICFEL